MMNKILMAVIVIYTLIFFSIEAYAARIENHYYSAQQQVENLGATSPYRIIKRSGTNIIPVNSGDDICLADETTCLSTSGGGGSSKWNASTTGILFPIQFDSRDVIIGTNATTTDTGASLQVLGGAFFDEATTTGFTINGERFADLTGTGLQNSSGVLGLDDNYVTQGYASSTFLTLTAWYATTTDGLSEGSSNLYYTDSRVDARINATSSIGTLTSLPNLTTVGTITSGTWNADTLTVTYGGTGSTTLSGILKGNGTSAVQTAIAGTDYLTPTGSSLSLTINNINGATNTLERLIDAGGQSTGSFAKTYIVDDGDSTLTINAGNGLLRDENEHDSTLNFASWSASSTGTISTTSVTYYGIEYNAGSPRITQNFTGSWNSHDEFSLGLAVRENGTTHLLNSPQFMANGLAHVWERLIETEPFEYARAIGGGIIGDTGTNELTLTASEYYHGFNEIECSAQDTSVSDNFTTYYRDGSGNFIFATSTTWDNANYDDGSGTLAAISNNRYANHWIYLDMEEPCSLILIYGREQFTSQAGAEAELAPSTVPLRVSSHSKLIARLTFQESGTASLSIGSTLLEGVSASAASDHGLLSGLTDDDHSQYLLVNGTRAMTGTLQMGSNNISGIISADTAQLTVTSTSSLGTIESGTWNGTAVGTQYGGTGQDFSASNGLILLTAGTASAVATSSLNIDFGDMVGTVDISDQTNLVAGTNLTLSGDTLNVDDASNFATSVSVASSSPVQELTVNGQMFIDGTDSATSSIQGNIEFTNNAGSNGCYFIYGATTTLECF